MAGSWIPPLYPVQSCPHSPPKAALCCGADSWCTQSFSELGVSGGVCLFAVDEHQRSQSMCDLTIGNDHGW